MLSEEKEQKPISTNAIARHNVIPISPDQQSWSSSFSFIQICLHFFNKSQLCNKLKSNWKDPRIELPKRGVNSTVLC